MRTLKVRSHNLFMIYGDIRRQCHTHLGKDNLDLFRQVNRLVREGKWDPIGNQPRLFLFGKSRKEAQELYQKFLGSEVGPIERSPYRNQLKALRNVVLALTLFTSIGFSYNRLLPEQWRFKYKYGKHSELEHHAH